MVGVVDSRGKERQRGKTVNGRLARKGGVFRGLRSKIDGRGKTKMITVWYKSTGSGKTRSTQVGGLRGLN